VGYKGMAYNGKENDRDREKGLEKAKKVDNIITKTCL